MITEETTLKELVEELLKGTIEVPEDLDSTQTWQDIYSLKEAGFVSWCFSSKGDSRNYILTHKGRSFFSRLLGR